MATNRKVDSLRPISESAIKVNNLLRSEGKPLSQVEITNMTGMPYQTVVTAVKSLIAKEYAAEWRREYDNTKYIVASDVDYETGTKVYTRGTSKFYYPPTKRDMYAAEILEEKPSQSVTVRAIDDIVVKELIRIALNTDAMTQEDLDRLKEKLDDLQMRMKEVKRYADSLTSNERLWNINTLPDAILMEGARWSFDWKDTASPSEFQVPKDRLWVAALLRCVNNVFLTIDQVATVFASTEAIDSETMDALLHNHPELWLISQKEGERVFKMNMEHEFYIKANVAIASRANAIKRSCLVPRILGMEVSDLVE